jgi:fatty acid desaturase
MATFPHNYVVDKDKCVISIDGQSYDVTSWRSVHPGGAESLDNFHQKDATEAFYALHSKEAIAKLKKLHSTTTDYKAWGIKPTDAALAFREFRKKLEQEGWFDRNWVIDGIYMLAVVFMVIIATLLAKTYPLIASLFLGLAIEQAGWLGHDYGHGRGKTCVLFNIIFGQIILGFSSKWWSHKHNTHHVFPNRLDVDVDIHNEPIIHLWFPKEETDRWYRKYQHIYYPFAYSLLHVSWRIQSIEFVIGSGNWNERLAMSLGYLWLISMGPIVSILGVLIGGFLVAIVVTCNHQTEDIIPTDSAYCYVTDNFTSTRGVRCDNAVTEYLFGGMQYQLEHHLFPTMPRYYYPELRPILKEFSSNNKLPFKVSGVQEIIMMNYEIIKKYSG